MTKKAMLGHKVRRLRRETHLTQANMAEKLGISASYLNLIESNQRPLTIELLLKLGQTFDLDLTQFAEDDEARLTTGLTEVFGDPLISDTGPKRQEILDLVSTAPAAAQAVIKLYKAYSQASEDLRLITANADKGDDITVAGTNAPAYALEEVRDHVFTSNNYFPQLEEAAEEIWASGHLDPGMLHPGLVTYLDAEFTLRVRIMPTDVMGPVRRRYDRHGRRILLSEMLDLPSRNFALAFQIATIRYRSLLNEMVDAANLSAENGPALLRLAHTNYLAAAILMPYDRFHRAATGVRYDLDILRHRFEASFEQVCHRLTTLQKPGAKGIPFFFLRVDKAGNVSKRFAGKDTPMARQGGACPRWHVHDAFRTPGRIILQTAETQDGARFFSVSRTVTKEGTGFHTPRPVYAVALGCDIDQAAQLVYADGMDLQADKAAVPIGLNCRLCERPDCPQRAFPPVNTKIKVDENVRGATAYEFAL